MEFFSKKNTLVVSLLGTIVLSSLTIVSFSEICRYSQACVSLFVRYDLWDWANYILITPLILLLSLLTYWLNQRVFESWKKFAVIGVPIVLVLTYFITRPTGGSNFFTMDWSLYFLAVIYGLFFLISLIIIMVSVLRSRR